MDTQYDSFINNVSQHIHTVSWLPEAAPRANVVLAHGIAEHSGRYEHVAEHLTSNGIALHSLDYRGHGRSEGDRLYFNSFEEPASEVIQRIEIIQGQYPDLPLFLYGHSMGALITMKALADVKPALQQQLSGWIASGIPLVVERIQPKIVVSLGLMLARLIPDARLIPAAIVLKGLAHDPAVFKAYKDDPLVSSGFLPLRISSENVLTSRHLQNRTNMITLPLLVIHGGDDPISPPAGAQILYDGARSQDKTIHIYDGLYHEIHNEMEKAQVFNNISNWIIDHIA